MIIILLILIIIFLNNNVIKEGFNTCSEFYSNNLSLLNMQPKISPLKGYEEYKVINKII